MNPNTTTTRLQQRATRTASAPPARTWADEIATTQRKKLTNTHHMVCASKAPAPLADNLLAGCAVPEDAAPSISALNAARRRQQQHECTYDVVSNAPRIVEALLPEDHAKPHPSHAKRHTPQSLTWTNLRPLEADRDAGGRPVRTQRELLFGGRTLSKPARLLPPTAAAATSRTIEHVLPTQADRDAELALSARKFWRTHNFHPISQQYVDGDKETVERAGEHVRLQQWAERRSRGQIAPQTHLRGTQIVSPTSTSRGAASFSQITRIDPFELPAAGGGGSLCSVGIVQRRRHAHYAAELGERGEARADDDERRCYARVARGMAAVAATAESQYQSQQHHVRPRYNVITGAEY